MHWIDHVQYLKNTGIPFVLITVISAKGSTPRNAGTKMIVTKDKLYETIGGGNLELQAVKIAQEILETNREEMKNIHFPLGPKLGQCCGGATDLLFEPFLQIRPTIYLFGAGHVGKALVTILENISCQIIWVDSRNSEFPDRLPSNVIKELTDAPEDVIYEAADQSYFLVMTHNHSLDQNIVEKVLKKDNFSYLGLIGSKTKKNQFFNRMKRKGLSIESLQKVTCPIGIEGISGKKPYEIAVSVSAQLLQEFEKQNHSKIDG